jgi:hypothetical protein
MSSLSFQTDVRKMVACFLELLLSWEEGDLGDVLLAVISLGQLKQGVKSMNV